MIQDLCIIMLTAGITSLVFKAFKQPVVLGYIVAGMLVGPHVLGGLWVTNEENVETWGEIGVLFLLFSLGLEFSFKKLLKVGSTAVIGAGVIVVGMMIAGMLTAHFLGLGGMNALFLGGMLCMSSTTIVFKAIEEAGLRSHRFAGVCFGILIVEDLFAVVLMVLLTSIAVKNEFEGKELLWQVGKLVMYIAIWFIMGILLIPTFLKKFKKHLNDETLTIFSIGLCLGMVLLAVQAGFSSALGAFVMGSVLAETIDAERIEHLVQPVKNIFGSIFFVSVGMMINPALLLQYWLPITIITLVVIFGQILFGSLGTLLSGQPLRVALQTGFSLVQSDRHQPLPHRRGSQCHHHIPHAIHHEARLPHTLLPREAHEPRHQEDTRQLCGEAAGRQQHKGQEAFMAVSHPKTLQVRAPQNRHGARHQQAAACLQRKPLRT